MPILTGEQLTEIRQKSSLVSETPDWNRGDINNAIQAIEDWYEAERSTVSGLIDTATSPFIFSNAQKKRVAKWWLLHKWGDE